ncbi:hypothetical protein [Chitinophaga japonensis]|uniref:Uncharacterized protein n=1 Tax=Chitinophaga japonensis TaxID=104662 RepID=A0A562STA2_CHIJA|nr:hypothetical protein [Chitinophaga japonensis]TWI84000.1 hypothetical protein LX66_4361 [Chitinophaga japonensis]
MKKKTAKKLRLDKIRIAKLNNVPPATAKGSFVSGAITICGASICICSWPTEDC